MSNYLTTADLSIIIQGNLNPNNIEAVANNVVHWRKIFPQAEIILAISSVDGLRLEIAGDRVASIAPDPVLTVSSIVTASAHFLANSCDIMVIAAPALTLPPIKSDSSAQNHVNLQIAAARRGLAEATRSHVLRVRGDLVFLDQNFIEQWQRLKSLRRGKAAILMDRVLASNLYTLNPYTYERLPFHISDWFHFGRTVDVRLIWDVPFMSFADASYYAIARHHPASNLDERKMLCRLAVEQHIIVAGIGRYLPGLTLEFHNDWTSREGYLDFLCDNFIIADLVAARCLFPKYAHDIGNPRKIAHCISQPDWQAMTMATDRRAVMLQRADEIRRPEKVAFPRSYEVRQLNTKSGQRTLRDIVSTFDAGVLVHGPYDTLPRGSYLAKLRVPVLEGPGWIELRVTAEEGHLLLGSRTLVLEQNERPDLWVSFAIIDRVAFKVEVVVTTSDLPYICVQGVDIFRMLTTHPKDLLPTMQSRVGVTVGGALSTSARVGYLLFGPYLELDPGQYRCELGEIFGSILGFVIWEVTGGFGKSVLARCRVSRSELAAGSVAIDFIVDRRTDGIEFRLRVSRASKFSVRFVRLFAYEEDQKDEALVYPSPNHFLGVGSLADQEEAEIAQQTLL